jgi:hypothetical protein
MPRRYNSYDTDFDEYLNGHVLSDDDFFSLPEEVQEQVNAHDHQFRSYEDMRRFIRDLMRRA